MSKVTIELTHSEYLELIEFKKNNVSRSEYNKLKEECKELENGYAYHHYSDCYNRHFYTKEDIKEIIGYDVRCKITEHKEIIERRLYDSFSDMTKKEFISKNAIAKCSLLDLLRLRKKCKKEMKKD